MKSFEVLYLSIQIRIQCSCFRISKTLSIILKKFFFLKKRLELLFLPEQGRGNHQKQRSAFLKEQTINLYCHTVLQWWVQWMALKRDWMHSWEALLSRVISHEDSMPREQYASTYHLKANGWQGALSLSLAYKYLKESGWPHYETKC